MSGMHECPGRRCITVVGAGTQPSRDPEAPRATAGPLRCAPPAKAPRSSASTATRRRPRRTWRQITEEGGTAAVVVCDVTTEEGCRIAVAEEKGLTPDGIVLNVGTGFGMGVAGTSPDEWDRTFALNLRAHFMLVRRALVILPDHGSIVFIGSVAGLRPGSRIPAYDASKAGLIGLSRHVAMEGAAAASGPTCWPRPDRHPAGPGRLGRPALAHPDPGAARPPGHGVGGGVRRHLLALGRGQLRHRAGAGRRRGSDPRLSAHSGQRRSGSQRRPPPAPPRPPRRRASTAHDPDQVAIHVAGWAPGLGIVIHVGRRTRTVYRTPVNFFRTKDGFRFALTYGPDAEWVRNALAHGAVRLITHGKEYELTEPELVTDLHRQHVPAIGRASCGSCG